MSTVRGFDHVGITVTDLDEATAFFVALGLEIEGRTRIEGDFIDTVTGIPDARSEIVMLRPPGGGTAVELGRFDHPAAVAGSANPPTNELGLRSIAFVVDDIEATVESAATIGYGLVGGIGQHETSWKMAYIRGPEGIIVAVAQQLG